MKRNRYQQVLAMDENTTVVSQFGFLPLSVFKPGKGAQWKDIIGDSGDHQVRRSEDAEYLPGLRFSEFNPELAEWIVRYWSLEGDLVVDPFAGRATRGVVSLELRRRYEGYEIAPKTFSQSLPKIAERGGKLACMDGCVMAHTLNESADLLFTCQPYHRLEKYESCYGQLSDVAEYKDFLDRVEVCVKNCQRVMKPGKFLCWVCADWREDGELKLFHVDSIEIFRRWGFRVHDVIIIENISPFAPLQAGKVAAKRYTSKTHEYLLVFKKE